MGPHAPAAHMDRNAPEGLGSHTAWQSNRVLPNIRQLNMHPQSGSSAQDTSWAQHSSAAQAPQLSSWGSGWHRGGGPMLPGKETHSPWVKSQRQSAPKQGPGSSTHQHGSSPSVVPQLPPQLPELSEVLVYRPVSQVPSDSEPHVGEVLGRPVLTLPAVAPPVLHEVLVPSLSVADPVAWVVVGPVEAPSVARPRRDPTCAVGRHAAAHTRARSAAPGARPRAHGPE